MKSRKKVSFEQKKARWGWYFSLPVVFAAVSSLFGVRALYTGLLSSFASAKIPEMMGSAAATILFLAVVEWIYITAVKRASSRYLEGLMEPAREE